MAQKKSDILESLISQLEKKQADISCFLDLIDDYMALYDIKKKLKTDIKKRGVSYEAQSASGKATIIKQNQSVKDLVAVNKQMLLQMTISCGEITQCCAGQQITQRWLDTAGNRERKMMPILETLYMQRLRQSQERQTLSWHWLHL